MTERNKPANPPVSPAPQRRRPYVRPVLVLHGSVRQVTFGSRGPMPDGGTTKAKKVSDPVAKRDIVQVGTHPLGFGLYLYRYRPEFSALLGSGRHFGVMADEVEPVLAEAVARHPCGLRMVDHEMLGIRDIGQRLDS